MPRVRSLAGVLLALALLLGLTPVAQAADPIDGVSGAGTAEAPFLVGTPDEFLAVAEFVNAGAPDSHLRLTADLDFGGATFSGLQTLTGSLDGAGHTISNITYSHTGATDTDLGLVRNLTGGTVRDLVVDGITATAPDYASALVVRATKGAVVEGNVVVNADIHAQKANVAGLVAWAQDGLTVTNNLVHGTFTASAYPAALVGYGRYFIDITHNLVDAELHATGTQARGGMLLGYQGNPTRDEPSSITGNVLFAGDLSWTETATDADPGRAVRAHRATGFVVGDNLANQGIAVGGVLPIAPGTDNQHGTDTTVEQLATPATYEALGWDLTDGWRWDDTRSHPVPAGIATTPEFTSNGTLDLGGEDAIDDVAGDGTEASPLLVDDVASFLAVTDAINTNPAAFGAAHVRLTADVDLDGATFTGIDQFAGVLDGNGHAIRNVVYGAVGTSGAAADIGLVRNLTGTVRDLMVDSVTGTGTAGAGGIAANATGGAQIVGNAVINADLTSSGQYAAGIVGNATSGVTISGNWVHGLFTADRYPSALVGYARYDVVIEDNLIDARTVSTGSQGRSGLALSYQGAYSVTGRETYVRHNVVHNGQIDWALPGDAGRIAAFTRDAGFIITDNLANENVTVGGTIPEAPGVHNKQGTPTSVEALAQQATYEALGWSFDGAWRWDAELAHPVPAGTSPDFTLVPHTEYTGPVETPELEGVHGSGTEADPYVIVDAAGLATVATAINTEPALYGSAHYQLGESIDFGGKTFEGLDTFMGVLDGAGHKIFNIAYGPSATSADLGLIRVLSGGTVRNLTVDGISAHVSSGQIVSALVVNANNGAVVDGNSVLNSDISTNAQYAAGLVANSQNGVSITNNWVTGTYTANRYPAAITGYARYDVVIEGNLVDATIASTGSMGRGSMVMAYQGSYSGTGRETYVRNNVVLGEEITWRASGDAGIMTAAAQAAGFVIEGNLVADDVTIAGSAPDFPGENNKNGTPTASEALAEQATYEALGWEFGSQWRWEEALGHPVPAGNDYLLGAGTEQLPFQIWSAADLRRYAGQDPEGPFAGAKHVALMTDLDFTDEDPFPGIPEFSGTFHGNNHALSDLTYTGDRPALFGELTGTVRELRLVDAHVTTDGAGPAAALAAHVVGGHVEAVTVLDAVVAAPNASAAAALVAQASAGAVVHGNDVVAQVTGGGATAVLVAEATDATVTENIVEGSADGAGATGLVAGRTSGGTLEHNVAYSGSVTGSPAGRILGDGTAGDNLALAGITVDGTTVTDSPAGGTGTAQDVLQTRAPYDQLGWDFVDLWQWDLERLRPVIKFVAPEDLPNRITTTIYTDASTERAFTWYQNAAAAQPAVLLSTDAGLAPEHTTQVAGESREAANGGLVYQAVATGLEPGTTYHYRVGDALTGVWGATGSFTTADGEDGFSFINLTDTQAKAREEAQLAARTMGFALESAPDAEFVLHGGDVVQDGYFEQDWIDLFDASQEHLLATTMVPASGNHDMYENSFIDHFKLPAPNGQDTSTGAYYAFRYDNAHFIVLNTNEDPEQAISDAQADWVLAEAEAARADGAEWVFLSMHKGMYTPAAHAEDADIIAMREVLLPIVAEAGIDLVFQGHDHYFARTLPLTYDVDGPAGGKVVETPVYAELRGGIRREYAVGSEGTIYYLPQTAGAKHYNQLVEAEAFDAEAYLQLFDRLGTPRNNRAEVFSTVRVDSDRLTIDIFEVGASGKPQLMEGFGIDKLVTEVDERLEALPAAADATLADAAAATAARQEVAALSTERRGALTNLDRLTALEQRLRELRGLVSSDGAVVAWADPEATSRQLFTVRNDTDKTFTETPVRIALETTPDVAAEQLAFFATDGTPLSHEVETWQPDGASVVWVKLPEVTRETATSVWGYFGGGNPANNPADVWSNDYLLVEHFNADLTAGTDHTDSTGRATGELLGADLTSTTADDGSAFAAFAGSRLSYGGNIGADQRSLSVSAVYSFDPHAAAAGGAVVAKQHAGEPLSNSYAQVLRPGGALQASLGADAPDITVPADGQPHLVTQMYDGMTYAVFVDGTQAFESKVEFALTSSDHRLPTTIGDLHTRDGSLAAPFTGRIEGVQIAGRPFIPEFESFRFANQFGDAVTAGPVVQRAAEATSIVIGSPAAGTELEAGLVEVTGTVSERSRVVATLAGRTVFDQQLDAGDFTVSVPLNALGQQLVSFTATGVTEGAGAAATATLDVVLSDTVAPEAPAISDDADDASEAGVTISAEVATDDLEQVEADFFVASRTALTEQNVTVRTGSTTDRTPANLTPTSGEATDELLPTTIGDNANPFQIYEIALTPEQIAAGELHWSWDGTGDDRRVSAWVWSVDGEWVLADDAASADGEPVSLAVTTTTTEAVVDGKLNVLVWRGLLAEPFGDDHTYDQVPDEADFDWGFVHMGDTQLYSQSTPWMKLDMFEHLVDVADERKTEIVLHAGDWVNRQYQTDEFQWESVDPAAQMMEDAGIPYMVSWGNHDYGKARNENLMLDKYFPMSRFEDSVKDTPFTFGGSRGNDNFYYTAELSGAKLLFLAVGFYSAEEAEDNEFAWAQEVIESHPEHTVILATHHHLWARGTPTPYEDPISNPLVQEHLVDPYPNVKLVFSGHQSGTLVTDFTDAEGNTTYGILTDYQTRAWGGHEFYRTLSVDAENGLLYSTTYSPWLDRTTSDARWNNPVPDGVEIKGYHGNDAENFVLELDLGAHTTRTLATDSMTLSVGEPTLVGQKSLRGAGTVKAVATELVVEQPYLYWVELNDEAGNTTRSRVQSFTVVEPDVDPSEEPSPEPTTTVTVTATPSPAPTVTTTATATATVTASPDPAPTVTTTATATATATVTTGPAKGDLYSTPGFHNVNGRQWYTECEPYSQTIRCTTSIWGTTISEVDGRFVSEKTWVFNNLTYLPQMTRAAWGSNPLANAGEWTAADGRKWRTVCDTAETGRNGCRSYVMADFIGSTQAPDGTWTHGWTSGWVFNNLVRFR